jgi:hypothetical protein
MSAPAGAQAYQLAFRLSPIILTGGIAAFVPGGMLPIISITEALNFTIGLLSGSEDLSLDNFFANFLPLDGATLIDNAIGQYPFANQAVAANAIIAQPLSISMLMLCPARGPAGYASKTATMMALQTALAQHNNSGGTYTVATPTYFYTNCLMTGMRSVAPPAQTKQLQSAFQIDFKQPLLTLQAANQALNAMMGRISEGLPSDGSLSGLAPTVGTPQTLATSSVAPAAANLPGTGVAAPIPAF